MPRPGLRLLSGILCGLLAAAPLPASEDVPHPGAAQGEPREVGRIGEPLLLPYTTARHPAPRLRLQVNGQEAELGLDSGAQWSVISASLARQVGARELAGVAPQARDARGDAVPARAARVDLGLGQWRVRDLPVLVMPDETLSKRVLGVKVFGFDGLLGWNLLKHLETEVDPGTQTLRWRQPSPGCAGAAVQPEAARAVVELRLDGAPLRALLDSAAQRSFLRHAPADAAPAGQRWTLTGAAGGLRWEAVDERQAAVIEVADQRVTLDALQVRSGSRGSEDLVLGWDLLGRGRFKLSGQCFEWLSP
jgi:hypothetical protein